VSYKVYLFDALSPVEWSQAAWRREGDEVSTADCERELICDVMLRHLPKDGLVVDAGCGTAKWPLFLRARGYRVIGVDVSHRAGVLARRASPGFGFVQGDVRTAPLRDGCADAVISLGVIEHDEVGPLAALREARRILRRDGVLVLSVPFDNLARRAILNRLMTRATERRRRQGVRVGFVEYRFTADELRRHLADAGFEPRACYPNDYRPPLNVGLWVDHQNITFNPLAPVTDQRLFRLPGWRGVLANALVRVAPWLVCGEITYVARAA
jgi:SAM-dependent methyltransferase